MSTSNSPLVSLSSFSLGSFVVGADLPSVPISPTFVPRVALVDDVESAAGTASPALSGVDSNQNEMGDLWFDDVESDFAASEELGRLLAGEIQRQDAKALNKARKALMREYEEREWEYRWKHRARGAAPVVLPEELPEEHHLYLQVCSFTIVDNKVIPQESIKVHYGITTERLIELYWLDHARRARAAKRSEKRKLRRWRAAKVRANVRSAVQHNERVRMARDKERELRRASPTPLQQLLRSRIQHLTSVRLNLVEAQSSLRETMEAMYRAKARAEAARKEKKTKTKDERACEKACGVEQKIRLKHNLTHIEEQGALGKVLTAVSIPVVGAAGLLIKSANNLVKKGENAVDGGNSLLSAVLSIKDRLVSFCGKSLWFIPIILILFRMFFNAPNKVLLGTAIILLLPKILPAHMVNLVSDYFRKDTEVETQASGFTSFGGLISSILCFSVLKDKVSPKMVSDLMRRISVFERTAQGWDSFIAWLIKAIETGINFFLSLCSPKRIELVKDSHAPMRKWQKAVDEAFAADRSNGENITTADVSNLVALVREGAAYKEVYRTTGLSKSVDDSFVRASNLLIPYMGALQAKNNFRVEPLMCMLYGAPGVGKTLICTTLCCSVLVKSGLLGPDVTIDKLLSELWQKGVSDFWNSYSNQLAMIMDDAFQMRPIPGDKDSEYMNIIRAVSSWAFPLNFADLASKGKIFFGSKFILGTTNVRNLTTDASLVINDPEAVTRRITHSYKLSVAEPFALPDGKLDWQAFVAEEDKLRAENVRGLDRFPWHVWKLYRHDFRNGFTYPTEIPLQTAILEMAKTLSLRTGAHDDSKAKLADLLQGMIEEASPISNIETQAGRVQFDLKNNEYFTFERDARLCTPNIGTQGDIFCPDEGDSTGGDYSVPAPNKEPQIPSWYQPPWLIKTLRAFTSDPAIKAYKIAAASGVLFMTFKVFLGLLGCSANEKCLYSALASIAGGAIGALTLGSYGCTALMLAPQFAGVASINKDVQNRIFKPDMTIAEFLKVNRGKITPFIALFATHMAIIAPHAKKINDKKTAALLESCGWASEPELMEPILQGWLDEYDIVRTANSFGITIHSTWEDKHVEEAFLEWAQFAYSASRILQQSNVKLGPKSTGIKPQSPSYAVLGDIIYDNVYAISLTVAGVSHHVGQMAFMCDTMAMMPQHFLSDLIRMKIMCHLADDDRLTITHARNPNLSYYFTYSAFCKLKKKMIPEDDLVFVNFADMQIRAHRNITKFCLPDSQMKYVAGCSAMLSVAKPSPHGYDRTDHIVKLGIVRSVPIFTRIQPIMYTYEANSGAGDCGAPLVLCEPHFGSCVFVGIHAAGKSNEPRGFSCVVSQEKVYAAIAELGIVQDEFIADAADRGVILTQSTASIFSNDGTFQPIAVSDKPMHSPKVSKITRTPIYGFMGPYDKYPAPLRAQARIIDGEKKIIAPMEQAMSKYSGPIKIVSDPRIKVAVHVAMSKFHQATRNDRRDLYTYEEAVVGIPAEKFRGIPRDTSAGYPYCVDNTISAKHTFFGVGQEYDLTSPQAKQLEERVEHIIDQAKKNVRLCHIFADFLKDELRTSAKVEAVATRAISASPLDLTIAYRIYFGAFTTSIMRNTVKSGMAPGINVYQQWNDLAIHLQQKGGKIFDGDFKSFDSSELPTVFTHFLDYINAWYGDSAENQRVRRVLWCDLVHSRHIGGNDHMTVYQWNKSLPSGHPLTTVINSMYSLVALVYAFLHIFDEKLNFWDHCAPQVYGDDNVVNVSDFVAEKYNQVSLAPALYELLDLVYTPGRKDGVWQPTCTLSDITFLKRSFHLTNQGYVAPLELDSFLYLNYYVRNLKLAERVFKDNFEFQLRELSLHTQDVWNEHITNVLKSRDLRLPSLVSEFPIDHDTYLRITANQSDAWY